MSQLTDRIRDAITMAEGQRDAARREVDRMRWGGVIGVLTDTLDRLTGGTVARVATVATPPEPEPPTTGPRKGRLAGLIRGRS
jgi:hypothetical protein